MLSSGKTVLLGKYWEFFEGNTSHSPFIASCHMFSPCSSHCSVAQELNYLSVLLSFLPATPNMISKLKPGTCSSVTYYSSLSCTNKVLGTRDGSACWCPDGIFSFVVLLSSRTRSRDDGGTIERVE